MKLQHLAWKFLATGAVMALPLAAQSWNQPAVLDPTLAVQTPQLESSLHQPLPEQFIWSAGSPNRSPLRLMRMPHPEKPAFRADFSLASVPGKATLYLTGVDHAEVWLNGHFVGARQKNPASPLRDAVFILNVTGALRTGGNVLAVRAWGGFRLAAKLVAAGAEVNGPALLISNTAWKFSLHPAAGWEQLDFVDSSWAAAHSLGGIESNIDFLQWNQDTAMYQWPGYDGISPFLAHLELHAQRVEQVFAGNGSIHGASVLTGGAGPLRVEVPDFDHGAQAQPSLVLDFGRESTGRVRIVSASDFPTAVVAQYGESIDEALHGPWLGQIRIVVPPHATVYGPKSAFRYVYLRFQPAAGVQKFARIDLDDIYYPVHEQGAFESSDAMLNRIWQVGAYTAHLCMQDDIWDAPKRDRGRWMGDLDVSGRVIETAFADHFLMTDTMDHLIAEAGDPVDSDVNNIPGYSAFWIMGEHDYTLHTGDRANLEKIQIPLRQLVRQMETEMDAAGMFVNAHHAWPFVDWSPDLNGDTAAARFGTELEFYRAFRNAAWLMEQAGNSAEAAAVRQEAARMKSYIDAHLVDEATQTFGPRRQINAMAIFAGLATPAEDQAIWRDSLSLPLHFRITPYYNAYVIDAMAKTDHRRFALNYIRNYWGGMIKEGATSFWEAYDPRWPKTNFHNSLRADDGKGYFVSLAHGWSTGPTYWLTEQILGIKPLTAGFATVSIRPDLAGLEWARGAEPTPHGVIQVSYRAAGAGMSGSIEVPAGVMTRLSLPVSGAEATITLNGHAVQGRLIDHGHRRLVELRQGGTYHFQTR